MYKQIRDADIDERAILRMEAIITSMTKKERSKPDILNASRRKRIAAGAGVTVEEVNKLIKQYAVIVDGKHKAGIDTVKEEKILEELQNERNRVI